MKDIEKETDDIIDAAKQEERERKAYKQKPILRERARMYITPRAKTFRKGVLNKSITTRRRSSKLPVIDLYPQFSIYRKRK